MNNKMSVSNVTSFWTFINNTGVTYETVPQVFNTMDIESWVIYANLYKSWITENKSDKSRLKKYHKRILTGEQYRLLKLLMAGVRSEELAVSTSKLRNTVEAMVEYKRGDELYTKFEYLADELGVLLNEYVDSEDSQAETTGICSIIQYQDLVDYLIKKNL